MKATFLGCNSSYFVSNEALCGDSRIMCHLEFQIAPKEEGFLVIFSVGVAFVIVVLAVGIVLKSKRSKMKNMSAHVSDAFHVLTSEESITHTNTLATQLYCTRSIINHPQ
ncbi:hypothetical protein Leryth_024288 [Lithospermum erythrorhizon]|nr:hypothetical protein Leryth_024288 [Lithospermum erythrorhizon]